MSKQTKSNKYNRTGPGANRNVFDTLADNTGKQETENIGKKKATFEMDPDLHRKLRRYAADHDTTMVKVVEKALHDYFQEEVI